MTPWTLTLLLTHLYKMTALMFQNVTGCSSTSWYFWRTTFEILKASVSHHHWPRTDALNSKEGSSRVKHGVFRWLQPNLTTRCHQILHTDKKNKTKKNTKNTKSETQAFTHRNKGGWRDVNVAAGAWTNNISLHIFHILGLCFWSSTCSVLDLCVSVCVCVWLQEVNKVEQTLRRGGFNKWFSALDAQQQ